MLTRIMTNIKFSKVLRSEFLTILLFPVVLAELYGECLRSALTAINSFVNLVLVQSFLFKIGPLRFARSKVLPLLEIAS